MCFAETSYLQNFLRLIILESQFIHTWESCPQHLWIIAGPCILESQVVFSRVSKREKQNSSKFTAHSRELTDAFLRIISKSIVHSVIYHSRESFIHSREFLRRKMDKCSSVHTRELRCYLWESYQISISLSVKLFLSTIRENSLFILQNHVTYHSGVSFYHSREFHFEVQNSSLVLENWLLILENHSPELKSYSQEF